MKSHRLLLSATFLAAAVTVRAAEPTPASTKAPAKTPAARVVENAPENFPLTLRGFFGKGDKVEVSVQDKTSGKSVWLSPGSTHTGWKLESADATTGRAVFSQGARWVNLFQAVESHQSPAEVSGAEVPKLKSRDDSVVFKKIMELKAKGLLERVFKQSEDSLRESHPEYFYGENSRFNERATGAIIAQMVEARRLMEADSTPEAAKIRPIMAVYFDAVERAKPYSSPMPSKNLPYESIEEQVARNNQANAEMESESLRIFQVADELYRQRTGVK